jgi:hypothetical protein
MKEEGIISCKICGKNIDQKSPHFIVSFNKEAIEDGTKKILQSLEAAHICEECGEEGLPSVLWHLKIIHDADTELEKRMELVKQSVNILELMKDYGISGEKIGVENQYLTKCPFHGQEFSFVFDAEKKEYFCFCEGLRGDIFSFVINYDRDINHKHMTLKQAVDYLMEKFPIP